MLYLRARARTRDTTSASASIVALAGTGRPVTLASIYDYHASHMRVSRESLASDTRVPFNLLVDSTVALGTDGSDIPPSPLSLPPSLLSPPLPAFPSSLPSSFCFSSYPFPPSFPSTHPPALPLSPFPSSFNSAVYSFRALMSMVRIPTSLKLFLYWGSKLISLSKKLRERVSILGRLQEERGSEMVK